MAATSARPDFWEKTLQNWQSEFLAVGSMAILAVYLRQRGSPESKPVGAPHTPPAWRADPPSRARLRCRSVVRRAAEMSASVESGSRSTAQVAERDDPHAGGRSFDDRQPADVVPRASSRERVVRRLRAPARCVSTARRARLSRTVVDAGSRPSATPRTTMSRSVTMPVDLAVLDDDHVADVAVAHDARGVDDRVVGVHRPRVAGHDLFNCSSHARSRATRIGFSYPTGGRHSEIRSLAGNTGPGGRRVERGTRRGRLEAVAKRT